MTIGSMISRVIIGPLLLLFETFFSLGFRALNGALSLAVMTLGVHLILLPLFIRAEAAGRGEGGAALRLPGRKKRFSVPPVLMSVLPFLLRIPVLIAAYRFLGHLYDMQWASVGPLKNLSLPDQLLRIGGMSLNLLPLTAEVFSLAAGWLYTRKMPVGSRILCACVLLLPLIPCYGGPAGFALYWTLSSLLLLGRYSLSAAWKPRWKERQASPGAGKKPGPAVFLSCALALVALTGLLVPSTLLAASPQEFIYSVDDLPPVWQVVNTALLASGVFLFWTGLLYALSGRAGRKRIETVLAVLLGVFLVNDLFFRGGMGTISTSLQYDQPPEFPAVRKLLNLGVLAAVSAGLVWLSARKKTLVRIYAFILAGVMTALSAWNVYVIQDACGKTFRLLERNYEGAAEIPLDRDGKNVVVLMLDRAISSYIPCILQENPELAEVYSGFTYYPNTLSFGMHTNIGAPALFGGYEYTPAAMNARPELSLREKHNEALLLLPTLFQQNGYGITVFDVPYPGDYSEAGDYSLFDSLPDTNARIIHQLDSGNGKWERLEDLLLRNLFCYSLTTCSPDILYGALYNMGSYNRADGTPSLLAVREIPPVYEELDVTPSFLADFEVLKNLGEITAVRDTGKKGTFLLMVNTSTHTPALLKEPEYEPGFRVDNREYDAAHRDRFLAGPLELKADTSLRMAHYHVNMAALRKVGDWLEKLKAEGVYDNTRIIIAADHGFWLRQIEEGILEDEDTTEDVMGYNPLLMVKDFGAEGPLRTDTAFMTNADVPTLALEGIAAAPVNPFTGKPVSDEAKEGTQYVSISHEAFVSTNNGNRFIPSKWYAVDPGGTTLFDRSRWHFVPDEDDVPLP